MISTKTRTRKSVKGKAANTSGKIAKRITKNPAKTTLGIAGYGTMGTAIVSLFASLGYSVIWWGRDEKKLLQRLKCIKSKNVFPTTDLKRLGEADIIIEAIVEDSDVKYAFFRQLDKICPVRTIFTSNTSSIPISSISRDLLHASRFAGLHFFNPAEKIELVEIVRSEKTSSATLKTLQKLVSDAGKTGILINDSPGFVVNRLLFGYLNNAIQLIENNIASKRNIDKCVTTGLRHPMGPFALMDFIGLDVCLDILEHLYKETRDKRYKPAKILLSLVSKGRTGKKTGRGFYDYK